MKRFITGLAIGLLVVAGAAVAGSYLGDGGTWIGTEMGDPIILYDGSNKQWWRGDANGIGRVAEEYPAVLQYQSTTIQSSNQALTTSLAQLGQSWTSSPYGKQALEVVFASGDSGTFVAFFESSDDNTNWDTVMSLTTGLRQEYVFTKFDNVGTGPVTTRYSLPLENIPFDGRYRRVSLRSASAVDTVASAKIMQRQF